MLRKKPSQTLATYNNKHFFLICWIWIHRVVPDSQKAGPWLCDLSWQIENRGHCGRVCTARVQWEGLHAFRVLLDALEWNLSRAFLESPVTNPPKKHPGVYQNNKEMRGLPRGQQSMRHLYQLMVRWTGLQHCLTPEVPDPVTADAGNSTNFTWP